MKFKLLMIICLILGVIFLGTKLLTINDIDTPSNDIINDQQVETIKATKIEDIAKKKEAVQEVIIEDESFEEEVEEVIITDYERYNQMSSTKQEEFFNSFTSSQDFIDWYNKAKAEYFSLLEEDLIIINNQTKIELEG